MKKLSNRILALAMSICMVCGMLPMSAHATETEHTCDWGEWTFNKDGTHTRVCNTDSTHIENGNCAELEWTYDSNGHSGRWLCDVCNGGVDKNSMDYPEHIYSNDTDLTCDTCGYVRSVEGSLSITGDLPAATVGVAYSASLSYTGEVSGVVFWNATGLPDGLTVDYGTGTISGTPTTAGTYEVTISMGATGGGSASKNFTLTVNATHTHVWSEEWSGTSDYHWHECIAEGCDLTHSWGDGKGEYGEHAYEITSDTHSRIDVGTGFGYHYGTCTICGRSGSRLIIAATRQSDATHHWYECPCGVIGWDEFRDKAEHSFDDDADMICDGCGYDRTPKSPASVTKAPEAITGLKFKEENGIEVQQILVTAGEAAGGTMVYRIDDGEWSTTIPARGQVRDYTVYYKVRGDSDHNDSAEGSVRVSIAKADAPIVSIPTQQHVYTIPTTGNSINIKSLLPNLCAIIDDQSGVTETTGDFIKNAVLNNGVLTYDTDAVNAPTTGTIKVKIVMRNYEDVTVTVNVELIDLNPVSNSGTDAEIKYDGSTYDVSQMFTIDGNAGEASYTIVGGTGTGELNGSVLTITKAGTIQIKLTTAATANYAAGEATATLTVEKGTPKITVSIEGWTYGEEPNAPTSNGPGDVTYTYDNSAGALGGTEPPIDAGMWVVVATYTGNDLYKDGWEYVWFTIEQKELTPAISGSVSKTYDGTTTVPDGLSITLSGVITGDDVSAAATYAYESADVGTTKIVATITLNGSDAKNYKVATTASADVGEILPAPHVHSYGTAWNSDGTNHWHECSCGAKADSAAHSGGTATCTSGPICMDCGTVYGEPDPYNHDFGGPAVDVGLDETHRYYCQREGCNEYGVDYHVWVYTDCTSPGKCDECGAEGSKQGHKPSARTYLDDEKHYTYCVREGCGVTIRTDPHAGGTATCTEKAVCEFCAQPYGNTLGHDWGNWLSNNDGTHTRTCANDANHTETNDCSGGTATCTEKAKCSVCAAAYGDLAEHTYGTEWKSDGTNHWHECSCGAKADSAAHSGGTATCKDKAVCSVCGTAYGDLDSTNHAGGTEVKDAKEATCGEGGYTGDTYCKGCGEVLTKGTATNATGDHTYGNWKVVKEATTTAKGKEQRTCSACGHVESRDIPMISDVPQTGDESDILLWAALMCVGILGVVVLLAENKRRRSTK